MIQRRTLIAFYLLVLVVLTDQLSKWWVVNMVMHPPRVVEQTSFLNFVLVWNKGVTFGLFDHINHHFMPFIIIGLSAAVLFLLGRWLWRTSSMPVALALGALFVVALEGAVPEVVPEGVVPEGVARGAPVGGCCSAGLGRLLVGVFSVNGGLAPAGRCRAASLLSGNAAAAGPAGGAGFGCTGVSTLPRMTGRPSLPLPMITILVLGDCASWSVASMPRQRT